MKDLTAVLGGASASTESAQRKSLGSRIYSGVRDTARNVYNSVRKTIAPVVVAGAVAAGVAGTSRAANIQWGPNTADSDIFYNWGNQVLYSSSSVNISDVNGNPIPSNMAWSLIYVADTSLGPSVIGQVKGVGSSATGNFSAPPWDSDLSKLFTSGRYVSGINLNADSGSTVYGWYDNQAALFYDPEKNEFLSDLIVTYDTSKNTFTVTGRSAYEPIPEPSTLAMAGIGALTMGAAALRRRFTKRNSSSSKRK
jgi:hypothetical protein